MKKKKGLFDLAKKTFAVITASMASLSTNHAEAMVTEAPTGLFLETTNHADILKSELKPKLTLKLLANDPAKSILFMHTSHRSHSSHSSHASHYSSSSGSSYTPRTVYTPPVTYTPSSSAGSSTGSSSSGSNGNGSGSSTNGGATRTGSASSVDGLLSTSSVWYRTLYLGCEGSDVLKLQQYLKGIGYTTPQTSYFGPQTEEAVKKFQTQHEYKPNGIVGKLIFDAIKEKYEGKVR